MNKNRFLWYLYDFANSVVMITFLFYFSQWLVIEKGKPDWWYNVTLMVSSLIFVLTAPIAGQVIDRAKKKMNGLRFSTLMAAVFFGLTAVITITVPDQPFLTVITYTLALYFYLFSFIYYTPLIKSVSSQENHGLISGIGQSANYAGQIIGLLIALPLVSKGFILFGDAGRAQTLFPATIIFFLLSLPMLLFFKENTDGSLINEKVSLKTEYGKVFATLKEVFKIKKLGFLLVAYFLFSDALLTFANNFPIFLQKVHGTDDQTKTFLTAGILIMSVIGSIVFGKISDTRSKKTVLLWLLAAWVILLPMMALAPSFLILVLLTLILGLIFGPVWGISRAMVAEYSPSHLEGSSFGYYVIAERFATFAGPIVWSLILAAASSIEPKNYILAVIGMSILLLVSIPILKKVE